MAHFRVFRGTEVFLQNSGLFFQYLLHVLFNNVCFRFNMHMTKYDSKMSFLFDVYSILFFFSEENAKRNRCGGLKINFDR